MSRQIEELPRRVYAVARVAVIPGLPAIQGGQSLSGYTKNYRVRFKHPLFESGPWCRGYAWDWMIAQASWKPRQIDAGGKIITLDRGQFSHSVRFMSEIFGWSRSATDRFLTRLKTETMIETATGTGQLIITICNYERYQAEDDQGGTATGTATGTAAGQQRDKQEELKEINTASYAEPQVEFRERILEAMGADPLSGMIGPNGKMIGRQADMVEAERWIHDLGLTEDQAVTQIREIVARASRPITSFRYFNGPMADLAATLAAPALKPTEQTNGAMPNGQAKPSRDQITAAAAAIAGRLR